MPLDALTYSFIAKELDFLLKGGKIDKIAMPDKDEIILSIHANGKNHLLYISAGNYSRVHLTDKNLPSPAVAFSFCMHLRKNIGGGYIQGAKSVDDERIVNFDIVFRNELGVLENKTLVCEMMGKYSNVLLIAENGRISDCLKHVQLDTASKRPLLAGLMYTLPPLDRFSPLDYDGIMGINYTLDVHNDIIKNVKGLSPTSVSEAVFNADLKFDNANLFMNENNKQKLALSLKRLYTEKANPCILESDTTSDFFIRPYKCLGQEASLRFFDSINQAVDCFYRAKSDKARLESKSKSLVAITKNALKRAEKRLSEFLLKKEASKDLEDDRIKGELITANIYKLNPKMTSFSAVNYYSENQEEIQISLDTALSPSKNAQKYFKRYAKKKRTLLITSQQISKTENEISILSAILEDLVNISDESELFDITAVMIAEGLIKQQKRDKSAKPSKPHKITVDGFNILIGKNNSQNDRITKSANKNDIWLHIKDFAGSHVIIETENRQVPENVLLKAASYAVMHSKAKQADKAVVDYTLIKHVNKPIGAAPGKVIYKNQKTIIVKNTEL